MSKLIQQCEGKETSQSLFLSCA